MTALARTSSARILYVEDNPAVADAIHARFTRERRFEWLGILDRADDLIETVADKHPDVVILDLDLPGADAIDQLRALTLGGSATKVVVFSGRVNVSTIDAAVQAGAWGYISKNDGEDAIVDAVDRVLEDEFVLSPEARLMYGPG